MINIIIIDIFFASQLPYINILVVACETLRTE